MSVFDAQHSQIMLKLQSEPQSVIWLGILGGGGCGLAPIQRCWQTMGRMNFWVVGAFFF